jgi:uncharacterized coiled-coil protein SlyX
MKEIKVPFALKEQSMLAGDDNLHTDITKTPCSYYVTEKRKWLTSQEDDEYAIKLKYALAPMVAARGMVPGSDVMTYFDGCVIPDSVRKSYNIDDECVIRRSDGKEYKLDKTSPITHPQGCLIDFSGNIGDTRKGKSMSEEEFNKFLEFAYDGMNSMDEALITNLKTDISKRDKTITEKNNIINAKETEITALQEKQTELQRTINRLTGLEPSFTYVSSQSWVPPFHNYYIAKYEQLGIDSPSEMSITFWITIYEHRKNTRNILQIYAPDGNSWNSGYNPMEDSDRKPAIFLGPNSTTLYVVHDTLEKKNENLEIKNVDGICMVGIVWNNRDLTVYINQDRIETYNYSSELIKPNKDALVFCCTRFWETGGVNIRYLNFYNTSLTRERYLSKYNEEYRTVMK